MTPHEVKALRRRLNLTQQQLATRLGVSRKTVNAVERGRASPSTTLALALQALDCRSRQDRPVLPDPVAQKE